MTLWSECQAYDKHTYRIKEAEGWNSFEKKIKPLQTKRFLPALTYGTIKHTKQSEQASIYKKINNAKTQIYNQIYIFGTLYTLLKSGILTYWYNDYHVKV